MSSGRVIVVGGGVIGAACAYFLRKSGWESVTVLDRGQFGQGCSHGNCGFVSPGKGYSITMRRPAKCPVLPMLCEEDRVAVTPMLSGYRLGSTMEFAGYDASLDRRRPQHARRFDGPGNRSFGRRVAWRSRSTS